MLVVITGAGGFLGSHVAMRYLDAGNYVIGLDNWCSSEANSAHACCLREHERCRLITCDITNKSHVLEAIDESLTKFKHQLDIDLIINFACPASPPRYQAIPIETMMTCFVGTKNMLEIAQQHKSVIIHASTSEVYGDPTVSPQNESYRGNVNTWGPRANYDEGKRISEVMCYEYLKLGVDVRVIRIFNTYGPHLDPDDGRVISNFVVQASTGSALTVYGSGEQTRSFCYVDDFVNAIQALAQLEINPTAPINIGNPNEFTINELTTVISELFRDVTVVHRDLPTDDPCVRCPDISRARELLKWEPKISLRQGLIKLATNWHALKIIPCAPLTG